MSNDPVLIAWSAKRKKDGKGSSWYRIGRAYPHSKGSGLTVVLDAWPLNGRVVLLELDEKDDERLLVEATQFNERKTRQSRKRSTKPA